MGLSSNGESIILTSLLTGRFVSLHTADPGNTGASEVSGGAYARQSVTFVQTGANPTVAANNAVVEFPVATANWGTLTHFGVWSAATGGTYLGGDELETAKAINVDDVARFLAGYLQVVAD